MPTVTVTIQPSPSSVAHLLQCLRKAVRLDGDLNQTFSGSRLDCTGSHFQSMGKESCDVYAPLQACIDQSCYNQWQSMQSQLVCTHACRWAVDYTSLHTRKHMYTCTYASHLSKVYTAVHWLIIIILDKYDAIHLDIYYMRIDATTIPRSKLLEYVHASYPWDLTCHAKWVAQATTVMK